MGVFFSRGDFSWEDGGTFPGLMRSYHVNENPIVSAVSEILRYKKANKKTDRLPVTLL